MFNTHYKRQSVSLEVNSGELITETAGYLPAKRQIENLMSAGQRLQACRREQFDFDGNEQIGYDPTRQPNYDMADASMSLTALWERERERKEQAKAEAKAEKEAAEKLLEEKQLTE